MRILALDLGTSCGWAISRDQAPYISGVLDLSPGRYSGGGMRFVRFGNELTTLLNARIDRVVFEEVRRHLGVDAAHIYGGLLAVLTAECERRSIPYEGVPVATIKKHATGKGNADKKAMVEAASAFDAMIVSDDQADALCLLDYAVKRR